MSTNGIPKRRHEGLVVREVSDEVLVYDLETHKAHCLNSTAAAVWQHCDGEASAAEIAFRLAGEVGQPVDEDVVWLALEDLGRLGLLESPVMRTEPGMSRGKLLRRVGVVTAAIALPTALSLNVPSASAAVCDDPCVADGDCTGTCTFCNGLGVCATTP